MNRAQDSSLLGGLLASPPLTMSRELSINFSREEIVSSLRILEIWEPHLQRHASSGNGEHSHELGMAVSAILITSHAAEMALKSLLAQTCPDENPRKFGGSTGHSLNDLFGNLPHESKLEVEGQFNGMPIEWENYAGREYGKSAEEVFRIADDTFVDWR